MVPPPGIEPGSDALQAPAMTTSAKAAKKMVLLTGNDPVSQPYQGSVIPLYYKSNWYLVTESNCRNRLVRAVFYH